MKNNNDLILDRLRGLPLQKGTWMDKFDPRNPNVPQANDNVRQPAADPQGGEKE